MKVRITWTEKTEHPALGLTVYAAVIPDFPFEAEVHVHYPETAQHIHNGAVKQKEVAKEMGGSGMVLSELVRQRALMGENPP